MPVTIKALKKEKNGLRNQTDALRKELKKLQARIDGKMTKETSRSSPQLSPVDQAEVSNSIEFLGLEFDDLNNFRCKSLEEISNLKANLDVIAEKVDALAQTIEEVTAMALMLKYWVYRNVRAKSLLCKLVMCVLRSSTKWVLKLH